MFPVTTDQGIVTSNIGNAATQTWRPRATHVTVKECSLSASTGGFGTPKQHSRTLLIAVITSLTSLGYVTWKITSRNSLNFTHTYARNAAIMKTNSLFDKIIQDQQFKYCQNYNETKVFNFSPVAVHKKLNPPINLSVNGSYGPVFSQTDHFDTTLNTEVNNKQVVTGAEIVTNGVKIHHSGSYYIYSSLKFRSNTTWTQIKLSDRSWFHYIHRISPNSPMNSGVLLRTVHKVCPECNSTQENIYTGGIFHLIKGDIIKVCLSGLGIADFSDESSYFGMFMLHVELGKPYL